MVVKKDTLIILHILKKLPDLSVYSLNLTLINQVVMSNKISRRKFIADTGKATAAVAGTVALQGMTFPSILDPEADIAETASALAKKRPNSCKISVGTK